MPPQPRREARYRFHRRTPWLYFRRDHPLESDTVRKRPRKYEESYYEQADRLCDILVLPDDDDWSDNDSTVVHIGVEM